MAISNKGQVVFLGLMIAVTVIVLALALAYPLKQATDSARNQSDWIGGKGLDCSNSSISDYDKGACTIIDLTTPYFIGALIAIAGIIFVAKIIIENAQ